MCPTFPTALNRLCRCQCSPTHTTVAPPGRCRCIDRVQTPGLRAPMDLWTYDLKGFSLLEGAVPIVTGPPANSFWQQFPPQTSDAFRTRFAAGKSLYKQPLALSGGQSLHKQRLGRARTRAASKNADAPPHLARVKWLM
jgi:hypothetical protein